MTYLIRFPVPNVKGWLFKVIHRFLRQRILKNIIQIWRSYIHWKLHAIILRPNTKYVCFRSTYAISFIPTLNVLIRFRPRRSLPFSVFSEKYTHITDSLSFGPIHRKHILFSLAKKINVMQRWQKQNGIIIKTNPDRDQNWAR